MNFVIKNLNDEEVETIENKLSDYDNQYIGYKMNGTIQIGIELEGNLIAGLDACMTAFRILYVSTVYVDEAFRLKGIGRMLIDEMEKRAKNLGANMIRLDTFGWQGSEFYRKLSYEQVGHYKNEQDDFEEYFFLKRL